MKIKYTLLALSVAAAPRLRQACWWARFQWVKSLSTLVSLLRPQIFNTDADGKILSNQKASSESSFLVAPLGDIAYTFGEKLNHQGFTQVQLVMMLLRVCRSAWGGYKYQRIRHGYPMLHYCQPLCLVKLGLIHTTRAQLAVKPMKPEMRSA